MNEFLAPSITQPALRFPSPPSSWLTECVEVLLPRRCLVCARPVRFAYVCYRCRPPLPDLMRISPGRCRRCYTSLANITSNMDCETCLLFPGNTDSVRFIWDYHGLARDLIRSMKYRPSLTIANACGTILREAAPIFYPGRKWDIIVPVPSSRTTFRKRLFHPCHEIARPIARGTSTKLQNVLVHDYARQPQATLDHTARTEKLERLFTVKPGVTLKDTRILLIEDVITTGATIAAASYTLKRLGASSVDVLALARTRVWARFRQRMSEIFPLSVGCVSNNTLDLSA